MSTYEIERYDDRESWLQARRSSLGSSDAAGVLGYSSWQSPFAVYVNKVLEPESRQENPILEWGRRLEPAIASKFSDETGLPVHDPGDFTIFRSVSHPWLSATVDRQVGVLLLPLEMKVAFHGKDSDWKNNLPVQYKIQSQLQLFVTGAESGYFAVFHASTPLFRWYKVARHEKFIIRMVDRLTHFWRNYIEPRVMPPSDYSESTTAAIRRLWPAHNSRIVEAEDPALAAAAASFDQAAEIISAAEKRKADAANRVRIAMEDAELLALPDGSGFSWKTNGKGSRTLLRKSKVRLPNE